MPTINGVKAEPTNKFKENIKTKNPSIKEVLERMQSNYDDINVKTNSSQKTEEQTKESTTNPLNINLNKSDLLSSLLPMLLSNKTDNISNIFKNNKNNLLQSLLKTSNNPMLSKILELMPQLNKKIIPKNEENSKKQSPKIDSFIKTTEYDIEK